MRVAVTGYHGFIGGHVLENIPEGIEILPIPRDGVAYIPCLKPDVVVNLAWPASDYASRMDPKIQIDGAHFSHAVTRMCIECGAKMVGIGSQAEKNTPYTPYAMAKCAARTEMIERMSVAGLPWAWIYIYSIYGPGECPNTLISYVIRELLAKRIPKLTNRDVPWDFLHAKDAVGGILRVAERGANGEYDLGSGVVVGTKTVARMIRDMIDWSMPLGFGMRKERSIELLALKADTKPLRDLAWEQSVSLEDGLSETIGYWAAMLPSDAGCICPTISAKTAI